MCGLKNVGRDPLARMVRLRPDPTTAVPPCTHVLEVSLMAPAKAAERAVEATHHQESRWGATVAKGGLPASQTGSSGGAQRTQPVAHSTSLNAVHRGFGGHRVVDDPGMAGDPDAIVCLDSISLDATSTRVTTGVATA